LSTEALAWLVAQVRRVLVRVLVLALALPLALACQRAQVPS
jgi:hypothetical protein